MSANKCVFEKPPSLYEICLYTITKAPTIHNISKMKLPLLIKTDVEVIVSEKRKFEKITKTVQEELGLMKETLTDAEKIIGYITNILTHSTHNAMFQHHLEELLERVQSLVQHFSSYINTSSKYLMYFKSQINMTQKRRVTIDATSRILNHLADVVKIKEGFNQYLNTTKTLIEDIDLSNQ